jgi:alpha-1,6-mannosyltransferase
MKQCSKNGNVLKVCDVVQSYGEVSGGVKRYVHDKMNYAASREDVEHVLVIPGQEDTDRREQSTRIYEVSSPPIPGSKGYRLLLDRSRILDIIREECPDVIEVGNPYWPAWVSIEAGRSENIPVVGFYHSDFPRSLGDKLGGILKSVGIDEVLTDAVETYLTGLYNKMSATVTATRNFQNMLEDMGVENVVRIPLGTDTQVFRPLDSRREILRDLDLPEQTFLMLFVGRFAGMKNVPELIGAMDHLRDAPRPVHLALMGEGEYADTVEKAARDRDDVTRWHYSSYQELLVRRYSAADLFVNPGTHETFGLVSVEAQACGARVLGVKGGGMEETLEGEEPLIMAESEQPEDIARAVKEIIALDEGEDARQRRRQRILENFSIEKNFDELFGLYERLSQSP